MELGPECGTLCYRLRWMDALRRIRQSTDATHWRDLILKDGQPILSNAQTGSTKLRRRKHPRTLVASAIDWLVMKIQPTEALNNSTPALFEYHLEQAPGILETRSSDARIAFVKSWNEWAEGNYLERHQRFGLQYLDAVSHVVT